MNERQTCDHCGGPVGPTAIQRSVDDRTYRFCCGGCAEVFELLRDLKGPTPAGRRR